MAYFEPTGCMFQIFAFHTFVFFFHQTPQSPLVRPAAHDELAIDNYALGTNAVVAVISYTVSYATCGVWGGGGGGVLPYVSYIGMCCATGNGF